MSEIAKALEEKIEKQGEAEAERISNLDWDYDESLKEAYKSGGLALLPKLMELVEELQRISCGKGSNAHNFNVACEALSSLEKWAKEKA